MGSVTATQAEALLGQCRAPLRALRAGLALLCLVGSAQAAAADEIGDFYRGKQITFTVGFAAGETYDTYARVAAPYLTRHLPGNPVIVVQNMPGVTSLKAADYLYQAAPRDGTSIGILSQTVALAQATRNAAAHYDAARFSWIGRLVPVLQFLTVWQTAPVQTIADATQHELIVAATSPSGMTGMVPKLLNQLAGTRFKIILGYPGLLDGIAAMEKGEVQAASASLWELYTARADLVRAGKLRVLVQFTDKRAAEFPDVPAIGELGRSADDRRILALYGSTASLGRAIMAPPALPPARLAALRGAFDAMVADPDFIADMKKHEMPLEPLGGAVLQQAVAESLDLSPALAERAASLLKQ
jgi:tripartite-type tricarboxylate transporter receptor subunit TctC